MIDSSPLGDDALALLRDLIRSACVNDWNLRVRSGNSEHRRLEAILRGCRRQSRRRRIGARSSDARRAHPRHRPQAPSLALVGHIDVVPVMHGGWSHDPFAADIVGDELYGRGTLDMLYLTAAYAVATRAAASKGRALRGDLIFVAVADEEGGSRLGIEWLMQHHPELIDADYVLTESGGVPVGG